MAVLPPVVATLVANTKEFTAKMGEARGEMSALQKTTEATGITSTAAFNKMATVGKFALLGVTAAAVGLGGEAVKMGLNLEDAQVKLQTAVNASGQSMSEWQPQIDATSKKLENLGFTNEQFDTALAKSVVSTQNVGKSLGVMSVAADLARFKHIDLAAATDSLDRALTGNLRPLKQMGIDLPIVTSNALKLQNANNAVQIAQAAVNAILGQFPNAANPASAAHAKYEAAVGKVTLAEDKLAQQQGASKAILEALSQRLSGQASAAADTYQGRLEVLNVKIHDVGAKVGEWLVPKLSGLIGWLERNKDAAIALAVALGTVLTAAIATFAIEKVELLVGGVGKIIKVMKALQVTFAETRAAILAEEAAVEAGNVGLVASFRATGIAAATALGPILLGLAAVAAGYKLWQDLKDNSGKMKLAGTGNLQQAIKEVKAQPGSAILNQAQIIEAAKTEVANFQTSGSARDLLGAQHGGGRMPTPPATQQATTLSAAAANAQLLAAQKTAAAAGATSGAATASSSAATKAANAIIAAHKAAVAKEVADAKTELSGMSKEVSKAHAAGLKEFNTLQSAIASNSMTKLQSALVTVHSGALQRIETRLGNTHKTLLEKLVMSQTAAQKRQVEDAIKTNRNLAAKLVATAQQAQRSLNAQLVAVAAQQRISDLSYLDQIRSDTSSNQATVTGDQATLTSDQIGGASAEQIALDQAQLSWDQQIGNAQLAVDQAANGTALQQAEAADSLNQIQAAAATDLANLSAAVSTGNAQASAASSAATAATTTSAATVSTAVTTSTVDQTAALVTQLAQLQSSLANSDTTTATTIGNGLGSIASAIAGIPAPVVNVSLKIDGKKLAADIITQVLRQARATGTVLGRYAGGTQTQTATGLSPNAVAR